MLQFANRFYGRIFTRGLNFWQQDTSNYWGHNAIVRIQPFADACDLPDLPWREPIGGKILSHDFVEAALMRRAGYELWLADDLEGSFEEGPPHLVAFAQRDRRWCQGNLQHSWLMLARGLSSISRLHFLNGIMAYLGSVLWFLFLVVSTLVVVQFERTGLSLLVATSQTPFNRLSLLAHGLLLLGLTAILLYAPKGLAFLDQLRHGRTQAHGGTWRSFCSVIAETVGSALIAPVLMLYHTQFVLSILAGWRVEWNAQDRAGEAGLPFTAMLRHHAGRILLCGAWGALAYMFLPSFFWWLLPVIGAVAMAPLTSSLLASSEIGRKLDAFGLWRTPEETSPPALFEDLAAAERSLAHHLAPGPASGALGAVLDPYTNALHVSLQESLADSAPAPETTRNAAEQTLREGWECLDRAAQIALLSDASAIEHLHYALWHGPERHRHPSWKPLLAAFATQFTGPKEPIPES